MFPNPVNPIPPPSLLFGYTQLDPHHIQNHQTQIGTSLHTVHEAFPPEKSSETMAVAELGGQTRNKTVAVSSVKTGKKRCSYSKGHWRPAEDAKLKDLIAQLGPRNWNSIAQMLPGRTGKSCRLRWLNQLHPKLNKSLFSAEEEERLLAAHMAVGNKWAVISRMFPGRTDNAVKNHWHVIMARRRRSDQQQSLNANNVVVVVVVDDEVEKGKNVGWSEDVSRSSIVDDVSVDVSPAGVMGRGEGVVESMENLERSVVRKSVQYFDFLGLGYDHA